MMEHALQRQIEIKRAAAVAVLFVGAAAARIFWVNQANALYGAESFYSWIASGGQFSPLYAVLAGFLSRVSAVFGLSQTQGLEAGTLAIYAVAGGLLVAPVYGIARRIAGETAAAAAGLATVFYPVSLTVVPGASVMTEPLYLLLVASAWYFLLKSVDEARRWLTVLGGLFVGLAYLARTDALPYMAFALALLLFATWRLRRDDLALDRAATNALLALAAFATVVSPYLVSLGAIRL